MITEELEKELSVNEMIGVVKYIESQNSRQSEEYLTQLEEWKDDGFGEVSVAECRETILS